MNNYELDQETMTLLLNQRKIVLGMTKEKQAKHLPKIDDWIEEISGLLDESVKEAV